VPSGEFMLAIDGEVIRGVGAGEVVRGEVIVAISLVGTLSCGTAVVLLRHSTIELRQCFTVPLFDNRLKLWSLQVVGINERLIGALDRRSSC
jgi:hypothetical protein